MNKIVQAIRVWIWLWDGKRYTDLSCPVCDSNLQLVEDENYKPPVRCHLGSNNRYAKEIDITRDGANNRSIQ